MQAHHPVCISSPAPKTVLAEDQDLIRQAAVIDSREAFDMLFQRHREGLLGLLIRKLRRHEDAQDALAITFYKAWRARSSFRGDASGKAWLYSIASNVALDMLRVRRRRLVEDELELAEPERIQATEETVLDPVSITLSREGQDSTRRALGQAMARLPQEDRHLVELFYYDGWTYQEIGSLVGASFSQIRGRLHRIRNRMKRDLVQRQGWQPA